MLSHGRVMLLGGLTASDTSTPDVVVATASGSRTLSHLPTGLHDTAAALLGGDAYLFGGGTEANTQSASILRVQASGGAPTVAGNLPAPSSDQSAAAIGGNAYIVGGYTGSRWLDTIVAWRAGTPARVVAHLPTPIRYAAVTAVDGKLIIAGGSIAQAERRALRSTRTRPGTVASRRWRDSPQPTTHAAAAVLDGKVYVIGGRGASLTSQTSRIVEFDPITGRVRVAGALSAPRSTIAAVTVGGRIRLFGGHGTAGTTASISELVPAPARKLATVIRNVYAHDGANMLTGAARTARHLVYVPNSQSATVDVIDPRTYRVVDHFAVGLLPQHVVPSYDLKTLYVTNDLGNSLTAIDPQRLPGHPSA